MEARELRIGDWILVEYITQQAIDAMCDSVNTQNYHGAHYGLVDPIPLTEEWLFKFGKIKWLEKDKNGYYVEIKNKKIYLEFVHSLQNMYFTIESKELK